jgi:hypothetical protein
VKWMKTPAEAVLYIWLRSVRRFNLPLPVLSFPAFAVPDFVRNCKLRHHLLKFVCGETEERIQISSPSTMEFESLVLKSIVLLTTALSVHLSLSPPNPPVKRDECTGSRTHTIFERLIQWITFASKVCTPFSFLGI